MAVFQQQVKLLEECRIAPPPGSVPPSSIPLTFFDLLLIYRPPVQRIFFYELSCSTSTFLHAHLPNLKHSLSLALQRFHPLAGRLVPGQDGGTPTICYSDNDDDYVTLTVAECDDDFHYLTSNHARDVTRFHSLVPELPICATRQPVLSLQVTLFPDHGIGVGICVHHAVADGSSSVHFMKTWASICRLGGGGGGGGEDFLPSYDRSVIRDSKGLKLEKTFLTRLENANGGTTVPLEGVIDFKPKQNSTFMATFVLTRAQLDKLVRWVTTKTSTNCSTFSLTCAVVWICVLKAKIAATTSIDDDNDDEEKIEWLAFVSNCRGRLGNPPIPHTYFGNCIGVCNVKVKRGDLIDGENGLCTAATAIWNAIQGLKNGGVLRDLEADNWFSTITEVRLAEPLPVSGSPNLGAYDVDFGWGKPKKVEMVLNGKTRLLSLAENSDKDEGGVEVGLALPINVMDWFASLLASNLKSIHA